MKNSTRNLDHVVSAPIWTGLERFDCVVMAESAVATLAPAPHRAVGFKGEAMITSRQI
jgi:hypothetical protein